MKKVNPLISVVIANFNGAKFLPNCLTSIFKEKGSYEVIVVDDFSTDNSQKYLKAQKSKLKIIFNRKNLGAAASRNIGAKLAQGKYLLFLDADTEIRPGWSKAIPAFFKSHLKAGIAQAKLLKMATNQFDYAGDYLSPFGFLIERARSSKNKGQFDKTDKIFALKSAAMIIKKDVFKKIGGFDKDYHIFWEDTDIAWRNWLAGYQVFFYPQITVYHAYGTEKKDKKNYINNKVVYRGCRNNITTLIKNLGYRKLFLILPANVTCWFILGLLFLIKLDFFKAKAIFHGIGWNLANLPRLLKKRKIIQSKRKISDEQLFSLVGKKKEVSYYFGKAFAYLTGKPF